MNKSSDMHICKRSIIPCELMDNPVIQKAARNINSPFHFNLQSNGMPLLTTSDGGEHMGHRKYNGLVRKFLEQWQKDLSSDKFTPENCTKLLDALSVHLRRVIEQNPGISLDKMDLQLGKIANL